MTKALEILRSNITAVAKTRGLWNAATNEPHQSAIAKRTNGALDQKTVRGMIKEEAGRDPRLESVEAVARALGLEPWQILVPNIDPMNPPTLSGDPNLRLLSPEEARLVTLLKEVAEEDKRQAFNLLATAWAMAQLSHRDKQP